MEDGFKNLAASIFLDMIDGKFHDKSQVRTMACEAWAYAEIFKEASPQVKIPAEAMASFEANMERKLTGCRLCFGSGGKRNKPCKECNGTGKIAQQEGVTK